MTQYVGTELDLFSMAKNWKDYWQGEICQYVGSHILEVGAGKGTNTSAMIHFPRKRWVCIEPDPILTKEIIKTTKGLQDDSTFDIRTGTIDCLDDADTFDTILYIDVLEHIKNDAAELRHATRHLQPNGHLIILSPAHQFLFSEFDKQVGHFRRYSSRTLNNVIPSELSIVTLKYLDSVGIMASLANKCFLKRQSPTANQLKLWDQKMVPISRLIDPLFFFRLGKSVLGIFRKSVSL